MLIIDDFNSEIQQRTKLSLWNYSSRLPLQEFSFILTTKESWATTLVKLNGGAKTRPLHGNVNDADYRLTGPVIEEPDWNLIGIPCHGTYILCENLFDLITIL
jgi:hypothetical protein